MFLAPRIVLLTLCFAWGLTPTFAQKTILQGQVYDKDSESPVVNAVVELLNYLPRKAAVTDSMGFYSLEDLPLGRQRLLVQCNGYELLILSDLLLESEEKKELSIALVEMTTKATTVENTQKQPKIVRDAKDQANNPMAGVSARPFTLEEVMRYAGSRFDPARMVTNYSGAYSFDDSRNDIVVRGNSPTHVLWQIEELPIENPNHISTLATTGGTTPILNIYAMGKADFMTGPFAAQYGNVIGGVFDIGMRRGSQTGFRFLGQIGTQRAEVLVESPLERNKGVGHRRASILFGARLSLSNYIYPNLPFALSYDPEHQDFNLKVFVSISKKGELDIFALGGRSYQNIPYNKSTFDENARYVFYDAENYTTEVWMGLAGLKYTHHFTPKLFWRTVAGTSVHYNKAMWEFNDIQLDGSVLETYQTYNLQHTRLNYMVNSYVNLKANERLFIRAGILANVHHFDLFENSIFADSLVGNYIDYNNAFLLGQVYAQAQYHLGEKITFQAGVNLQYSSLNQQVMPSPRATVAWNIAATHRLSAGYGWQHQMPNYLNIFIRAAADSTGVLVPHDAMNTHLPFISSHQVTLEYDWRIAQDWRLRVSAYGQWINNVPSTVDSSVFSPLNGGADFYDVNYTYAYLNSVGEGRNVGGEIMVEKFFANGFYGLLSASVFDSQYKGSDGVWRNTLFNLRYIVNFLVGYEVAVNKKKNAFFFTDLHFSTMGGRPYTPINIEASHAQAVSSGVEVYYTEQTNALHFPPSYRLDLKLGFRFLGKKQKVNHSIRADFFQILGLFGHKDIYSVRYSEGYQYLSALPPTLGEERKVYQRGFVFDLTYTIRF